MGFSRQDAAAPAEAAGIRSKLGYETKSNLRRSYRPAPGGF